MDGPLVDAEGFPRADIDLYQVRAARHSIACEWGRGRGVRRWCGREVACGSPQGGKRGSGRTCGDLCWSFQTVAMLRFYFLLSLVPPAGLQNDHKALMKQVEEALHQLHAREKEKHARDEAEARAEAMSQSLPPAFAKVNAVTPESPASTSVRCWG